MSVRVCMCARKRKSASVHACFATCYITCNKVHHTSLRTDGRTMDGCGRMARIGPSKYLLANWIGVNARAPGTVLVEEQNAAISVAPLRP